MKMLALKGSEMMSNGVYITNDLYLVNPKHVFSIKQVADVNKDGYLNVLDVIILINWVLNEIPNEAGIINSNEAAAPGRTDEFAVIPDSNV